MNSHAEPMLQAVPVPDNKKAITSNRRLDLLVGTVEGLTIAGIFSSFLTKTTEAFLAKTGRFILFPAAGALQLIRTGLALNQGRLEKWKNGTKEKAVLEVGACAMVETAVIGGLAEAPYAKFAPHIFTVMLSGKTIFHAGATMYYYGKAAGTEAMPEKQHYEEIAKANGIVTGALLCSAAATGMVMVLSETVGYAELGMASSIFAAGYQFYTAYNMRAPVANILIEHLDHDAELHLENDMEESQISSYQPPTKSLSNSAGIHRGLRISPTTSPRSENITVQDHSVVITIEPEREQAIDSPNKTADTAENNGIRTNGYQRLG